MGVFLAAFKDYRPHLAPGERAVVLVLAADRSQAQVIFRYVRGFLAATPMLARLVEAERAESIDLVNRVTLQVGTSVLRASGVKHWRRRSADEISFWPSDDGANPATEVLRAVRPALATIPDSLLLCISSPYSRSGPLYQAHRDHFGKDDSGVLVWQAPTLTMNPSLAHGLVDRALEADPQAARAEWLAEFRDDISSFLDIETIEGLVIPGRPGLAPVPGMNYRAFFVPPPGDARTASPWPWPIGNGTGLFWTWCADANRPSTRRTWWPRNFARCSGSIGAWRFTAIDTAPNGACRPSGIMESVETPRRDRSQIFVEALPLFTRGQVELLDDKTLKGELRSLERKTRPQGPDLITHGPGGHDDSANSACGALVLVGGRGRPEIRVRWI